MTGADNLERKATMAIRDPAEDAAADRALALRRELRRRWRAGDRAPIEELLQSDPSFAQDERVVLELIYAELRLRSRAGESPAPTDYASRFPALGEKLALLFEIHQALTGSGEAQPWESTELVSGDQLRAALAQHSARFDAVVEAFEQAWQRGGPPDIDELLRSEGVDDLLRPTLLRELVLVDLEHRWRPKSRAPSDPAQAAAPGENLPQPLLLEHYLQRWPELGPADQPPLELIVEEYRLRRRGQGDLNPDEYTGRFPGYGARLREVLVQVDNEFAHKKTVCARGAIDTNVAPSASSSAAPSEPPAGLPWGEASAAAGAYDPDAPLPYHDFRLIRKIGSGGMGTVYRAVQVSLNKPVAVKILEGIRLRRPQAVQRFLREGRSVAQLRHPHIVDVHGIGRTPNQGYFLVMDLVEGRDLEELIRSKAVSFQDVGLLATVAEAIEHAHRRGVIHRDLKPSNILVDHEGRVLVSDFGLAKLLDDQEANLSLPDEPLGTPSYMAPEQASSRWGPVGPRTDVYGLGGLLYAVLTGRPPYTGRSYAEVLAQVISDDPPWSPRRSRPEIPAALEAICLKCLEKDPARRFQTAEEVARALRYWIASQGGAPASGAAGSAPPGPPTGKAAHADDSATEVTACFDLSHSSGPPLGALPVDSEFYLVRAADHEFRLAVDRHDSIILVRGARQMGKTSLLARGLMAARKAGMRVALADFQKIRAEDMQTPERLLQTMGEWLADELDLDVYPNDVWDDRRSASVNFERYMRRVVLKDSPSQVLWALDEVDRLFACPFRSEVFGLFRSWHNARALQPGGPWSKLTLIMAYATEAHLFITDPNQSPFNVGTQVALDDFSPEQIAELNARYGSPLRSERDLERFGETVGGHPFLVSRGLYELASRSLAIDFFRKAAGEDIGLFGDHLRRLLAMLNQDDALREAFRTVLRGGTCPNVESFYALRSAGLITGESTESARPRCQLYAHYFSRRLP